MYKIDDYLKNVGNSPMDQRRLQDEATWKSMLEQINKTSPDTMLGYGLGKLLRGAYDHRTRRAAEKKAAERNAQGYQGGSTPETLTIGGLAPDAEMDMSKTIWGVSPKQGLLGDSATLGQVQTKKEVTQPDGGKETVTTTAPYAISSPGFSEQVAQAINSMPQNLTFEDLLKNPNAYMGYR